ncbi:helix-turn-helix domain-containing protein [Ligilactobacillus equi]|uniref:helix-turn-helix domain-containing protein n=1 Tax=Ligilactobacillus equi TaxID=137357 RepID=UPI00046B078A|nr:helix-turn-helix transcriptional regulator [Ligilactobacillus equi]
MENRIKELRKEKGLTLKQLSEKVGISNQGLSFYERGQRNPKIENWHKLADFFDVTVEYLQGQGNDNCKHHSKEKLQYFNALKYGYCPYCGHKLCN